MALSDTHDHVLEAGSLRARIARVYAEALMAAAAKQSDTAVDATGDELDAFVSGVIDADTTVAKFLASPAVGKRAKTAALEAALPGNASDLLRGLCTVLARNSRLDLLPGIAAVYREMLDTREGRVPVKVLTATELTDLQRDKLSTLLATKFKMTPVLAVHVDPKLLGGMIVQVGDRVIDTSVRTRLETIRTLLLDKGSSYVLEAQR
jgi:F-type H+-transporting ATPase subunit delta